MQCVILHHTPSWSEGFSVGSVMTKGWFPDTSLWTCLLHCLCFGQMPWPSSVWRWFRSSSWRRSEHVMDQYCLPGPLINTSAVIQFNGFKYLVEFLTMAYYCDTANCNTCGLVLMHHKVYNVFYIASFIPRYNVYFFRHLLWWWSRHPQKWSTRYLQYSLHQWSKVQLFYRIHTARIRQKDLPVQWRVEWKSTSVQW